MKYIFRLLIAVTLISAFSCSDENKLPADNSDSGWIQFRTASSSGSQSQSTIEVPLRLPIGTNASGQDITYSVTAVSGDVPSSVLGTYTTTLPAGDTVGSIAFNVAQSDNAYTILFTLLSSSNPDYQIGLSDGSKQITHKLFVNCAINVGTSYSGTVTSEGANVTPTNNTPFNFTATITQIDATNYSIDTAWGPSFVAVLAGQPGLAGQYLYPATITLNSDGTVSLLGGAAYATGGTGSYDPCADVFSYSLSQAVFTGDFTVEVVLSPM